MIDNVGGWNLIKFTKRNIDKMKKIQSSMERVTLGITVNGAVANIR